MIKTSISLGVVVVIGLMLGGCYTDYGPLAAVPNPIPPPVVGSTLQLGERLTVTVYGEPDLTGVYDVNPMGNLDLPLIGTVKAAGRTTGELEHMVADRYKGGHFLEAPKVTIAVLQYTPIYIIGEVEKPGQYTYRSGLDAIGAVAEAGGLTYRGSRSSILIQHNGDLAWTTYPLLSTVTILPGDHIRVPERYY